jgi:hypothetical protein
MFLSSDKVIALRRYYFEQTSLPFLRRRKQSVCTIAVQSRPGAASKRKLASRNVAGG